MGPCVASVQSDGALIAAISGGGETMSVVPMGSSLTSVPTLPVTYYNAAADAIEAGSTTTVLNLTAHAIRRGDVIIPTSGTAANVGGLFVVDSVTTNTVTLQNPMNATPAAADSVEVMRARLFTNAGGTASRNGIQVTVQENSQASAAGGLLKLIDAASGATDAGVAGLTIRDDSGATKTTTAGDYQGLYTNPKGALYMDYRFGWQSSSSDGLLKQEDAAAASGDAGVATWGVRNDDGVSLTNTDLDYSPIAVGSKGQVWTQLTVGGGGSSGLLSPVLQEDTAFSASNATMVAGAQAVSAIAQTVGATGDVAPPSMDLGNRLVTTYAPAGETWQVCSGAIATATNTSLKAAVASNRIYVTGFTCMSNAASANTVYLTDGLGGTALWVAGVVSSAVGVSTSHYFNPPLRGTSNTALALTTNAASSVICCANGYISTI